MLPMNIGLHAQRKVSRVVWVHHQALAYFNVVAVPGPEELPHALAHGHVVVELLQVHPQLRLLFFALHKQPPTRSTKTKHEQA